MGRYVIERTFGALTEAEMAETAVRAKRTSESFPQVTWEHSHVCVEPGGDVRVFCVYEAPDEDVLREHAKQFGGHVVDEIYEIVGDVTPADVST